MRKTISLIITFLFILIFIYFLSKNYTVFYSLKNISLFHIVTIVTLTIFFLFINGLFLNILAQPFNIRIKNHFLLSLASSFINLITPFRGGAGFRAWWMKEKYNLSYLDFTVSLIGSNLIVLMVNSFVATILLLYFYLYKDIFHINIFIFFILLFSLSLSFMIFNLPIKGSGKITEFLQKIKTSWECLSQKHSIILKLAFISVTQIFLSSALFFFILQGLHATIPFSHSLFLAVFSNLAIYINITPGSLGIIESLLILSGFIINIPTDIMLLTALIYRATTTAVLFTLGFPAKLYLLHKTL